MKSSFAMWTLALGEADVLAACVGTRMTALASVYGTSLEKP